MSASLIRIDGITWRAGATTILEGVSFAVAPGEFVALRGGNGAGKGTLLDIVGGLRRPDAGIVTLDGRAVEEWTPLERARRLGHLPQNLRADLSMHAESLVLMGRYPHASRWFEDGA